MYPFQSSDLAEMGGYVLAFAVAGAVVATLWDIRKYRVGKYAIWIIGMAIVMAAIMRMESGPVSKWDISDIVFGIAMSIVFGLAAAFGAERR